MLNILPQITYPFFAKPESARRTTGSGRASPAQTIPSLIKNSPLPVYG
jgi:hypothetical protein